MSFAWVLMERGVADVVRNDGAGARDEAVNRNGQKWRERNYMQNEENDAPSPKTSSPQR